jgi:DNA mismatch endonuclease (patch repair protein)
MADKISQAERSALMAKVRSTGNRSTEGKAEAALTKAEISGWEKHPKHIPGRPDFYFPKIKLVVFIDGCFWHACPRCGRLPVAHAEYWTPKIDTNRRRDNRIRRQLRSLGFHVVRIWEHDLKRASWLSRLERMIENATRCGSGTYDTQARQL